MGASEPKKRPHRRRSGKPSIKKVFLKSGARGRIVKLRNPEGEMKKKVKLAKKSKSSLPKQLNSACLSPKERTNEWLDNLDCKTQSEDAVKASPKDVDCKTIHPVERLASSSEESDLASTLEASFVDQHSAQPEQVSSGDSDVVSIHEEECPKPVDAAVSQEHSKNRDKTATPAKSSIEERVSLEKPASPARSIEGKTSPEKPVKQDEDPMSKTKGIAKTPLTVAKKMKSRKMYCRKEFLKFYLQNSSHGYHQALKKFHHKKLAQSRKHKGAVGVNDSIQKNAPLKIVVTDRLSSSGVADSLGPSPTMNEASTPMEQKMLNRVKLPRNGSQRHSVVSCEVPYDCSFEEEACHDGPSPKLKESGVTNAAKRDVCYIFALLDKEKEETLFKCTPQFKTTSVLQRLAGLLDSISADEDIMVSKKVYPTQGLRTESCEEPAFSDQSTSPIPFLERPVEDVPNMSEEEGSDDSGMQSDMDRKGRMVNATTKVIISKALLSFTSELKVLTDVSIRLLGWCTGTVKADLDSDSFEDEFEGFLCHCHDKVSIIIECLSELDSRQILNLDAAELHRFWLLHDALRCMLQAYRYIQGPSASPQLSQKLLSLMMTCSKTMLPCASLSLSRWMSLMTMVSGISTKLCEARLLSNACWCYQHFESLRRDRSCSMCDLKTFFEEVCNAENSDLKLLNGKRSSSSTSKTATQVLFPRFCWFLNEVEGLSKEEFLAALKKHSVVKFSCNSHSGLYPCDQHLSAIACSCFVASPDVELHGQGQTEGRTEPVHRERRDVHTVLNESSDQQIVPLCVELGVEEDPQNPEKCSGENVSAGGELSTIDSSTSKVLGDPKACSASDGSNDKSSTSDETVDLNGNGGKTQESDCEVVTLNEGSSSEDFSLHLEESSSSGLKRCNTTVQVHQENLDDTDETEKEKSSGDLMTKISDCTHPGQVDTICQEVETLEESDLDISLSSDSNLPLSRLATQEGHSKSKNSDNDSSVLSASDMEATPNDEDLMKDVSFEEDDVFEDLEAHPSMCAQTGSISSSSDEVHSSQDVNENTTRVLRSPPLFSVSSVEDDDSSMEVPTSSSRLRRCCVSSTQDKVVKKSISWNDISCNNKADQIQKEKEDSRKRLRQNLRSFVVKTDPPPEADPSESDHSNQTSTWTRKQEVKPPKQCVSTAVPDLLEEDMKGQQTKAKTSDKKVTFNDILQFKEFKDEPICGYGRPFRQMPENFPVSIFKERVESLLNSMCSESQENGALKDDKDSGPQSNIDGNNEMNDVDGNNMAPPSTEEDLPKSKRRKLSLQIPKSILSRRHEASDKIKQIGKLDEKFMKTFGPQRTEDNDLKSRVKRSIANAHEDASEKQNEENVNMKNSKRARPSEPKVEDAVPQVKMFPKSCLKKTIKTQVEPEVSSNTNHVQATENQIAVNSGNVSKQDASVKKPKKATRRIVKETQEDVMPTGEDKKSHGENPSSELTETKKVRKGKNTEPAKESGQKLQKTSHVEEISSGATKTKKESKRNGSGERKSENKSKQDGRKKRDLNVSDPGWKSYLSDLKERIPGMISK